MAGVGLLWGRADPDLLPVLWLGALRPVGEFDVGEVGLGRYNVSSAPSSLRVLMRTAVWTVMWR